MQTCQLKKGKNVFLKSCFDFSSNATIFKLFISLLVCYVCFLAIFLCGSYILGLIDLSIRVRLLKNLI